MRALGAGSGLAVLGAVLALAGLVGCVALPGGESRVVWWDELASAKRALPAGAESSGGIAVRFPGRGLELEGVLLAPAGPGARPAVVMLHGCAGFRDRLGRMSAHYAEWAAHWRGQGYVVLVVDSFRPRGEKEVCTQGARRVRASVERVQDAYSALAWLAGLTNVDVDRVVLHGWSNGATTALYALRQNAADRVSARHRFVGGVAFYPGCEALARRGFAPRVPILIQTGDADDWTPAVHCRVLTERSRALGASVEIDVYPGAHHGFDAPGRPVGERVGVWNPNRPGGRGATTGTDEEGRRAAIARTTTWVRALVG